MTTFLYNIILTAGAERVAQTDPHGWTLTVISVSVVFLALIVLCGIYSLSGAMFSGKFKRASKAKTPDAETAAAIALALSQEGKDDTVAAIALALELQLGTGAHDEESGVITMTENSSRWADKTLTFRRTPNR